MSLPSVGDELRDLRTLRDRLEAFGKNGRMRIVLVEPSATGRRALSAWLGDVGIQVAPFGDPHVAFLFLLARLDQVDGVLVNGDDEPRTSRLLQRLEALPEPVAVVTYSGRERGCAARIAVAGRARTHPERPEPTRSEEPAVY